MAEVADGLRANDYLPSEGLATAVFLALSLRRPLLLEGEAGVGKTEVAKTLAGVAGQPPHPPAVLRGHRRVPGRLRVGLLAPAAAPAHGRGHRRWHRSADAAALEDSLYSERFLVKRPLLEAISHDDAAPPVLLIDEVDRADDEFEAFLLEVLSDWSITVP